MSFHLTVNYEPETSMERGEQEKTVTLEVSRLHTVDEICQSLYKDLKADLLHQMDSYGLFSNEKKIWLKKGKPVGRELKGLHQAQLQFRLKVRPVTIRFLDASSKTLIIDESLSVKNVVADICKQLRIDHPEELSLVITVDYAVDKNHPVSKGEKKSPLFNPKHDAHVSNGESLGVSPKRRKSHGGRPGSGRSSSGRPGSAGGVFGRSRASGTSSTSSQMKKQISRKHQIRIDTPWLDPSKSLTEQDVTEEDELLLMYRFYYNMDLERDSAAVDMHFKQARATFLAREMLCEEDDIPKFTALLCQIAYGDFVSKEDTQEKLHRLKKTLLPAKLKSRPFVKDVAASHLLLNGLNEKEAKCWFIKLWSSMKSFGIEFISCTNWETKEKGLIGVSKKQIIFLHHNTKRKNVKLDISSLKSWELESKTNVVSLIFLMEGVLMKLMLHFPAFYSSIFIDCIQGNQDISSELPEIRLSQKEFQFDEEIEKRFSRYSQPEVHKVAGSRRHKRTGSLTLSDVLYWSETIETPLVSQDEKNAWKTESWENPAFENLDQLMDERFSFLDFGNEQQRSMQKKSLVTSSSESSPSNDVLLPMHLLTVSPQPSNITKSPKFRHDSFERTQISPLNISKAAHKPAVPVVKDGMRQQQKQHSSSSSYIAANNSSSESDNNSPVVGNHSKTIASSMNNTSIESCT